MKHTFTLFAFTCVLLIVGCNCQPSRVLDPSYTFVVAGDGRGASQDTAKNPSTSNLPYLKMLFADVDGIQPRPKFLFYNGDLVYGFFNDGVDTSLYKSELLAWIQVYMNSPLAKDSDSIKLVVIPGNHEIDSLSVTEKKKENIKHECPMLAKERIFVRIMGRFLVKNSSHPDIVVHEGPTPASDPQDGLASDQSRLTYSFDYNLDHFVLFNTDPFRLGNRIPWHWLKADLESNASRHTDIKEHHIFVFGHKPPYGSSYYDDDTTSMDIEPADRDSTWKYIEQYGCDAYFGSHVHLWDTVHPFAYRPKGKPGTWEIICGNAGAPMPHKMHWTPPYNNNQPYLGYTIVNIAEGKVVINSYSMDDTVQANNNKLKLSVTIKQ